MPRLDHRKDYYDSLVQYLTDQKMRQKLEMIQALTRAPTEIPEDFYGLVENMVWYLLVSPEMTELNGIQSLINTAFPGIKETLLIAAFREAIDNIFPAVLKGTLK